MSMPQSSVDISIVGLSVGTTVTIRNCLRQIIPSHFDLRWVNLAEPTVDLLIVHSAFVDSANVSRMLSGRQIPILKVSTEFGLDGVFRNETLYLPIAELTSLQEWLYTKLPKLSSLPISHFLSQKSDQLINQQIDFSLFEKVHDKEAGPTKILNADGLIGIVNTRKEQIWLTKAESKTDQVDHTWQVMYSTNKDGREVVDSPNDLRQWIWQTLWQADRLLTLASPEDYIHLKFWPHPKVSDRKDTLRMAAYFEHGYKVREVAEKSQISLPRVQHFASSLIAANLAKHSLAEFSHSSVARGMMSGREALGLRGFFSKLRLRLGL
ncbi:hypothetical protein [Aquirhabdus sp.]|uniref:hypothetical protein n=1 Tax=Aquirhabdus sp. TaxID=2824160 RepID=UPI00396D043D